MAERAANLNVVVAQQRVSRTAHQAAMQVLMSGGANQQRTELTVNILQQLTGRQIPRLGYCGSTSAEALKFYRDELGAAVVAAQNAISSLSGQLADTNSALNDAKKTVDQLLGANPDPTTPNSVDELTDSIGGLQPTEDRESLEQRVGDVLDLNIVNGVLYPKGTTQLGPLRQLVQSLQLQPGADLSDSLGAAAGGATGASAAAQAGSADGAAEPVGTGDGFLLVSTQSETIERVVGSTCGEDIVEFEVVETPFGTNVPIPDDASGLRMFWLNGIRTDPATLKRLRALGMTPEEVGAAVTGGSAGRMTSAIVDTTTIAALRTTLTDDEIITLLLRPDTASGINATPTADQVIAAVTDALNSNTGGNRNRAGTDSEAIDSGQAGRGGDPAMLLMALLDFLRSFRFNLDFAALGIGLAVDFGPNLVGATELDLSNLSDECNDVLSLIRDSINGLRPMFDEAQQFMRELFGNIALGNHAISAGVDFTSCLISFNLGLDFAISLSLALPFQLQVYLAAFTVLLTGFLAAVAAIRAALCIPQAVIQLLFGGVCGFKPFDFSICPPDIATMVDRLVAMLNLSLQLVFKLGGSMFSMKMDAERVLAAANQFKTFSPCALSATGIGLALGLGDAQLGPDITVSSPTVATT
jgi:hypothetical protein